MRDLLAGLRERGVAVLLNSHLLSEVELVCDRVAIMLGGRIVQEGAPSALAQGAGRGGADGGRHEAVRGRRARGRAARSWPTWWGPGSSVYSVSVLASTLEDAYLEAVGGGMSGARIVAGYAVRECLRRRVFVVVLILTARVPRPLRLGRVGGVRLRRPSSPASDDPVEADVIAGSTIFGLAMFSILFLGAVLAVFLTLGAVRGDAERGLLQPLVVRPLGRTQMLLGRFMAAAGVCAAYVLAVYALAMVITGAAGGWWPDRVLAPGLGLAAGVVVIAALALLGSVYLSATANGIAVFMVFGAGLVAGLLGEIGEALSSDSLESAASVAAWLLPFEALYQSGLARAHRRRRRVHRCRRSARPVRGRRALGAAAVAVGGGLRRAAWAWPRGRASRAATCDRSRGPPDQALACGRCGDCSHSFS